ncbi:hypothetical protein LDENG_00164180 [Lucifuga dentata]|nr:hypothetical protein LDENG_00164180 [Lucifuga dentata]
MLPLGQIINYFNNISFHFYADDIKIKDHIRSLDSSVKSSLWNLGVMLDKSMSLDCHVRQLVHSSFSHLRNITKLKSVMSQDEMEMIIHDLIASLLDYCKCLFTCLNKTSLHCLQTVQNAAAWLLTKSTRRSHITPILSSLHWLLVNFSVNFNILILTFSRFLF